MGDMKKLRSVMALNGENWGDLAEVLGLTRQSVSLKKRGVGGWTSAQIAKIKDHYGLTAEEICAIFFN